MPFRDLRLLRDLCQRLRGVGWLALLLASSSCNPVTVSRLGRPCDDDGSCPSEARQVWVCHPELKICVPEVKNDCPSPGGGVCPTDIQTGDSCPAATAFVPCAEGVIDCSLGCRTCGDDLTWSKCSAACTLGQVAACGSCSEDCAQRILHATAVCDTSASSDPRDATNDNRCDYTGACDTGWSDADDNRQNGCEKDWPDVASQCDVGLAADRRRAREDRHQRR